MVTFTAIAEQATDCSNEIKASEVEQYVEVLITKAKLIAVAKVEREKGCSEFCQPRTCHPVL